MSYAAFERMLKTERHRQRGAARGFSTPSLCTVSVKADAEPLLATNMRGTFLATRRGSGGEARFGFSYCPVGQEGPLLNELHRVLWDTSLREKWANRCSAVAEAVEKLRTQGIEAATLVVSERQLSNVLGSDFHPDAARSAMAMQGFVAVVDGMQVLLSDLPDGSAFVTGHPTGTGVYTRVGDHIGMLFQRVDRAIMVVRGVAR